MRPLALFLLSLFFVSCSCSKKEPHLYKEDVLSLAYRKDPGLEVIVPPLDRPLVFCDHYEPPCAVGYKVKIKGMEITPLYYKTVAEAKEAAIFIRGYQLENWAFDGVRGEPILERFFEFHMKAQKRF